MICPICGCNHEDKIMVKVTNLNLRGSEDDYLCPRCKIELVNFARSLQTIADKVRFTIIRERR